MASEEEREENVNEVKIAMSTLMKMFLKRGYHLDRKSGWPMNAEAAKEMSATEASQFLLGKKNLQAIEFGKGGTHRRICVFFHNDSLRVKDIQNMCLKLREMSAHRGIVVVAGAIASRTKSALAEVGPIFRMEAFLRWELLVDISEHYLVPKHSIISESEKARLLKHHKLTEAQIPRMTPEDPMARYLGMEYGDVAKVVRDSRVAGRYVTYRICM